MPKKIERKTPKYLMIGEILRPHGVRGEIRMRMVTDYPERLLDLKSVYLGKAPDDSLTSVKLSGVRFHKDYALLTIQGYNDRNEADRLRNLLVFIRMEDAVPLEEGEYYLFQLVGLTVVSENEEIGVIKEVLETGANDVYVVQSAKYGEILIPAHDKTIVNIDFDSEIITMSLPEGLLPSS